jgi:hypothetical protein
VAARRSFSVVLAGVATSAIPVSTSQTEVVAVAVASAPTSVGDTTLVANTGASITAPGTWQHAAAGAISSIVPASGQVGTFVTINGTALRGSAPQVVSVTLNGVAATLVDETDTLVRVRANSGAAGTGDVVVTASSGATTTEHGRLDAS